jgi:ferredoxin
MMETPTAVSRNIIKIDESKCDGCGLCLPNCPEGALQLIEGKVRLVSELCCDGLGACLGHCPQGAITVEERPAAPYNERLVMQNLVSQGAAVMAAHLDHLKGHREMEYLRQAREYLREHGIAIPGERQPGQSSLPQFASGPLPPGPAVRPRFAPVRTELAAPHSEGGCPGSRTMTFTPKPLLPESPTPSAGSELRQWPIQLHLINPQAAHFQGSDLLLAADCVPFALGRFHADFLRGKTLAIACPKLDHDQQVYRQKLTALIDEAQIKSITVMIMEVPCCRGLLRLAEAALTEARRKLPIQCHVVGRQGDLCGG